MNEWFKNTTAKLKSSWASWKPLQKAIAAIIVVVVIVVLVLVFRGSSAPTTVQLFRTPITDTAKQDEISTYLEQKNIEYSFNETTGIFTVPDERTARKVRTDLTVEGILSSAYNVWDTELNVRDWTTTDFERGERQLQRVNNQIKQALESLDFVANANVVINQKSDGLTARNNRPAQASVILTFRGETPEKRRIRAIQDLVKSAVPGLLDENITITDNNGNRLNDFDGMAEFDAVDIVKKQQDYRMELESKLAVKALEMLQANFTTDRVRNVGVSVEMDMSKVTSDKTEYSPFVRTPDNPDTPYSELETVDGVPISEQSVNKNGREPAIIQRDLPESKVRILLFIPTCQMSSESQKKKEKQQTMFITPSRSISKRLLLLTESRLQQTSTVIGKKSLMAVITLFL